MAHKAGKSDLRSSLSWHRDNGNYMYFPFTSNFIFKVVLFINELLQILEFWIGL